MFGHDTFANGGAALLLPSEAPHVDLADLGGRALRSSPYLALRKVGCECQDGVLTLRGCLPTYYLKQVAQSIVARVEGVRQVVNEIDVVCPGMHPAQRV